MLNFPSKFVSASTEYSSFKKHIPAPIFRKSFNLEKTPESAEILITGLGFYQLFVNGKDITKGYLAPYISNTDHYIYYDNYDLTPYLTAGENVIGVMLGDGMQNLMTNVWNFNNVVFTSSPKLALSFEAKAGEQTVSFEADCFKCTEGPITFNNHRCGVHYDARLEMEGWNAPGFDDSAWRTPIKPDNPRGKAKLCEADPIAIRSEIPCVSVTPGEVAPYKERKDVAEAFPFEKVEGNPPYTGGYIYDFGKNSAGIFRLVIKNTTPGQKISFQCAERLDERGRVDYNNINFFPDGYSQRDIYICKGADEEIYVPQFVYHGYRYLYVHGIREDQATKELLTYLEINTKLDIRATFDCSDDVTNKLFAMTMNSDMSNFHYFPTDCPHREKDGWTGDAAASSEHMVMTLSVENSWREWLNNIRAAQDLDGYLPGIVPTHDWGYTWGNGPAWDRVAFDLPYYAYLYRGETSLIRENASMMMRYLDLMVRIRDEYGLVYFGLGDWCPASRASAHAYALPLGFTNGIMIMDMCKKASIMFDAIGLKPQSEFAKTLWADMRAAVRKMYLDESTMTVIGCYQSGQAMAIYYDLLDPAEKKMAFDVLVDLIHKMDDTFSVGYLGARVIFHVLSEYGEADLAYKLITQEKFPSYGALVKLGMTTLPEHFASSEQTAKSAAGSLNHHFFGDINQWFMRSILGINVNPFENDPNNILIRPHFIEGLDYAEGTYDAPGGKLYVKWVREGETIKLTVKPEGQVKCNIRLDNGYVFEYDQAAFIVYNNGTENYTKPNRIRNGCNEAVIVKKAI